MLASRRWRDWTPPEKIEKCPEHELTKPPKPIFVSFGSSNSGDFPRIAADIPPHDPAEWREPFVRWLKSRCTYQPGTGGGVGLLHVAFCEWEAAHNGVPCTRAVFESLLWESGHTVEHGLTELILKIWVGDRARPR